MSIDLKGGDNDTLPISWSSGKTFSFGHLSLQVSSFVSDDKFYRSCLLKKENYMIFKRARLIQSRVSVDIQTYDKVITNIDSRKS